MNDVLYFTFLSNTASVRQNEKKISLQACCVYSWNLSPEFSTVRYCWASTVSPVLLISKRPFGVCITAIIAGDGAKEIDICGGEGGSRGKRTDKRKEGSGCSNLSSSKIQPTTKKKAPLHVLVLLHAKHWRCAISNTTAWNDNKHGKRNKFYYK